MAGNARSRALQGTVRVGRLHWSRSAVWQVHPTAKARLSGRGSCQFISLCRPASRHGGVVDPITSGLGAISEGVEKGNALILGHGYSPTRALPFVSPIRG